MKPERPPGGGPYREMPDLDAEALKKMEKEVAAEGKFSIHLPEDIKKDDLVPLFEDALNNNIDPKDIVFYSLTTGILKYTKKESYPSKRESFFYTNPDNNDIKLDIYLSKENPPSATIFSLSTKADIKKQELAKKPIHYIKKMAETGTEEELRELKIDLERILFTINDKLEKKK